MLYIEELTNSSSDHFLIFMNINYNVQKWRNQSNSDYTFVYDHADFTYIDDYLFHTLTRKPIDTQNMDEFWYHTWQGIIEARDFFCPQI